MSTRIYLESTSAAPAISPAVDAAWTGSAQMSRVIGSTTKGGSALTTVEQDGSGVNPNYQCQRQIIVGPLAAQTISGTVKMYMRGAEQSGSLNARHANVIRVIAPDGTTVRGTPRAMINGPEYAGTTLTNTHAGTGVDGNLTNVDAQEGDYLVIEIGFRYSATLVNWARQRFGSSAASDLPEDTTTTTDLNPWMEFSMDIAMEGGGGGGVLPHINREGLGGLI